MTKGKYRGIHNGGWKKGFLSYNFKTNEYEIVNSEGTWPVIEESVGQSIGRQDSTGVDIYEGDITNCGTVEWCDSLNWDGGGSIHPGFYFKDKYECNEKGALSYHDGFDEDIVITGNIHTGKGQ